MKDDDGKFTEEELKSLKLSDISKDVLAKLTAREAKGLKDRFGIELHDNVEFQEVGQQFEVTRARIKEIEERAMKKLKKNKSDSIRCSFCGKKKSEVNKLIGSNISSTYICGECIKTSMGLLDE